MRIYFTALVALAITTAAFIAPPVAHAAAQSPGCLSPLDPRNHTALHGVWSGDDGQWALTIQPCGNHSVLFWTDTFGAMRRTDYYAFQTLPGGGWVGNARPGTDQGPHLSFGVLGYKPAEPGSIQILFTVDAYGNLDIRHGRRV
jgi:hypothetical protein